MALAHSGKIGDCCGPNALMTLQEYLEDYASERTRELGIEAIARELKEIPSQTVRNMTQSHLEDIIKGQRDFRF
jgi:2-iminoacetate synthase